MKNVHLICNAHIDPMWLWRWEEGCASALSTFRTAAKLLDEYPELVFNHNEALLYDWVLQYDPALFECIQGFVKAGRWQIMGGWYLQPDCNMPAGEALLRNILEGRSFFREHFGKQPATAVNFDSFGHSRGLVQLLRKAGFASYVVCRPDKTLYPFENQDFVWRGLDGSEINVHRSDENYNSVLGHAARELEAFLESKKSEPVTLFLWGVGDHGGGPSRKDLNDLRLLCEKPGAPYTLLHSTVERYFAELHACANDLPVLERGLNPVAEGCYTSQIRVKQTYRRLENELLATEKMCTQASLTMGTPYPEAALHEAQKSLLFGQFHDALPGTGTQLVEEDTLRGLQHGLDIVARERMKAFLALSAHEPAAQPNTACVLLYNPHPFDISGPVAIETELPAQNWDNTFMYPRASVCGVSVPTQAEMEESNFRIDWRKKICVDITAKASSITRIDVAFDALPGPDRPPCADIVQTEPYVFDNGRLRAVIDTRSGMLSEYAVDGYSLLQEGGMSLTVREDIYNSWGLEDNAGKPGSSFSLLSPEAGTHFSGVHGSVIPSVRMIEDGPVRTVIESVLSHGDSKAVMRYSMPKHGVKLDVDVAVWWREKDRYLKLEMDCFEGEKDLIGQIPFGRERLAKGHEAVSQKWSAVSGGDRMLAVLDNGCYGVSLNQDTLGVTLLRGAGYSCSDCNGKLALREARYHNRMDQGERRFSFALLGGLKGEVSRVIDQEALTFNELPFALSYNPCGDGKRPPKGLTLREPNLMLSCFKKAEDGNGWILRLYEAQGLETNAQLCLPGCAAQHSIVFKPFEIKTFRLKHGLEECDILD